MVLGTGLQVDPNRPILPAGRFEWVRELDLAS